MSTIQRVVTLWIVVLGSMSAEASDAVDQYVAMTMSPSKTVSPSVRYHRHDWIVDMRQGDGDPRRHTCLSGVFARDAAYYPFHDHIDDGSLQHVDRSFSDGRGGYYHQRGFIWTSHGKYRESTSLRPVLEAHTHDHYIDVPHWVPSRYKDQSPPYLPVVTYYSR